MSGFDSVALAGEAAWSQAWSGAPAGWLNAATMGLPTTGTALAMRDAIEAWVDGTATPIDYGVEVERARASYARIVGIGAERVGIGATTSGLVAPVAASLQEGAEVLCVEGDFSSIVYPFLQQAHRGVTVRHVPLEGLADEIRPSTSLVSFSLIQSADGRLVDDRAVRDAAAAVGASTLCDTTQATGIFPVDAGMWDLTVCHSYKWLCAPRGAAFITATPSAAERIAPINAGWYAGEDVWASCYGPDMALADSARRFDTSPAWLAWAGAAAALSHFETVSMNAAWQRSTDLADDLLEALDLAPRGQAIIALDDPHGARAAALDEAGVRFARRAGRLRLAFHLWNTAEDIELVVGALRRAGCAVAA
jgi:selenocysteine lyase/cysteine desulfurase